MSNFPWIIRATHSYLELWISRVNILTFLDGPVVVKWLFNTFIHSSSTAQTYPEYSVYIFSSQSSGISVNILGKQKNICFKGNQTLTIFSGVTTFLSYGFLKWRHLKWW